MVRRYKRMADNRTYRNYSETTMDSALLEVLEGRLSVLAASRKYKIPYGSLYNKYHGRHIRSVGHQTALSAVEERQRPGEV